MKCPIDNATLVMSDKKGIEIDYCPECRGVWLDRGELDKIIERSAAAAAPTVTYDEPRRQERHEPYRNEQRSERYDDRRHDQHDHSYKKHKRKENFLGDLFDF